MNILLVGGTFDNNGGHPSALISKIHKKAKENHNIVLKNGGNISKLQTEIITSVKNYDVVMWFANVSNDEVKVRDVKAINPKTILITSKRNDNGKYTFAELITRALTIKANLTIEFSKIEDKVFNMMVFDPLGNVYYNGTNVEDMADALMERAEKLTKFTRVPSIPATPNVPIEVPEETEFFNFAHECADIFHNLIRPAKASERFLGNMSFRCQNGFPSFRSKDGMVFVSRRNVDKSDISSASFVPVYLDENKNVRYFGENKPSVDTPIQLHLYNLFPWANYMLHAHCYVEIPHTERFKTCTTFNPVPCGALEEVDEIVKASYFINENSDTTDLLAVNLIGHGCILIARNVDVFKELQECKDNCFIARHMPESPIALFKRGIETEYCNNQSFNIYFNKPSMDFKTICDLTRNAECGFMIEEFGDRGSMKPARSCFCQSNMDTIRKNICHAYNDSLLHMPNRIFTHIGNEHYHIVVIGRDAIGLDYHIFIKV